MSVEIAAMESKVNGHPRAEADRSPTPLTHRRVGKALLVNDDVFHWMALREPNSIHGIVTDPPYGVKEFELEEIERMRKPNGGTGIWRLPPVLDGCVRAPLPRFTALTPKERVTLCKFFEMWSRSVARILVPGAHVMVASNAFLSVEVFNSIIQGGLEHRGQVIRLVQTLRGGDRPKNAEQEFPDVCSLPRGGFEPWGIFRKPLEPKMKVSDCLREYGTGGLRRLPDGNPFGDVIPIGITPKKERELGGHPSQKPMELMKKLVHAILPLGKGVVFDPFMGSGTTVAAAEYWGYESIAVERDKEWFDMATKTIPLLSQAAQTELF